MPHVNADWFEYARVGIEESEDAALQEWLEEDAKEEFKQWLHGEDDGFLPTAEQEEAARDAAGYGQDDRVLCIDGADMTEAGQVIPEWAF